MKVGGVSEREGMDALFFKAVDKAVGSGNDFQSVLRQNKSKIGTEDFTDALEGSKGSLKGAEMNKSAASVKQTAPKDKDEAFVSGQNTDVSDKKVPVAKENYEKAADAGGTVKAETAGKVSETEISDETVEALSAAIVNVVSQILNMEPQQVEDLLSEIQINPMELLQPEKLMELLLATSKTGDITELLTNEELAGRLKAMEEALKEFDLSQYGITKEQLETLLSGQQTETYDITQKTDVSYEVVSDEKAVKKERYSVNADEGQETGKETVLKEDAQEQTAEKVDVTDLRERPETSENSKNADSSNSEGQSRQTGHSERNVHTEGTERTGVTEQFVNQLAVSSVQSEYTEDVVRQTAVMYREIVDQIVQQIRVVIRPDQTSMNMQLMPENLGRVYVNMTAKNGVVTATFLVQNEMAKEAIEANLEVFKQNLNQQGTKVEAVEVDVSDFTFGQKDANEESKSREEQEESESRGTRRRMSLSELTQPEEELSEEEQAAVDRMLQNGSTVEYTA